MNEVRLNLRDLNQDICAICPADFAERVLAALSADPATLDELGAALERFMKPDREGFFSRFRTGFDDSLNGPPVIVIDLAARLVVADASCDGAKHTGSVHYFDEECCSNVNVRFHLADEWRFSTDISAWRSLAGTIREERADRYALDVRSVLYGKPLLDFLAAQCFEIFPRREQIAQAARSRRGAVKKESNSMARGDRRSATESGITPDGSLISEEDVSMDTRSSAEIWPGRSRYMSVFYDTIKEIHARWLMSPREDLRGQCPREVLLAEHEHRMFDMQHRCDQWSVMQVCPRGVDESSHAFRLGGFGTHELVLYYDLLRELLWSCWERLMEMAESPSRAKQPVALARGDFLLMEVPRLETVRENWLDSPNPEFDGQTPRWIIYQERLRIPYAVSGAAAMIDPDCPCCQMLADLPGPMFWHLDASGMDYDFPFDIYHRTREEWEAEQSEDDCFMYPPFALAEKSDQENSLGLIDPTSVWSRSFSAVRADDVPMSIRIFGLGGHLAELIVDLREQEGARDFVDRVNRDFGNLREVLGVTGDNSLSTLVEPTILRFSETLQDLSDSYPDLETKCSDLVRQLQSLLDPPSTTY